MLSGEYKYDRCYNAIITPFKLGGDNVDEQALRNFVRYYTEDKRFMEQALGSIDVCPACGEAPFLSTVEKVRNLEIVLEEVNGRAPVFCGVVQPTTKATVEEAKALMMAGADGLFTLPPMAVQIDFQDSRGILFNHLQAIVDAVGPIPLIPHLRNVPVAKLCKHFNYVGWKMGIPDYWDWRQTANELRSLDHHVGILGAAGDTFQEHFANDEFDGTLTGAWNYAKEPMLDHMLAWKAGDIKRATEIWHGGLRQLQEYVFHFGNQYINYKVATWLHGLIPNPFFRPPLPQPNTQDVRNLKRLLEACGIECVSDSAIHKYFPDY